jgi:hypothetical protein
MTRSRRPSRADPRSDAALVEAVSAGDARALSELIGRYVKVARRLGSQFCREADAAREVQQDTLLSLALWNRFLHDRAVLGLAPRKLDATSRKASYVA